jgi:hypothetical protein
MDTKIMKKEYDKFNIPVEKIPLYDDDPKKFIGQYKKCSILTYGRIIYSDSSVENTKNLPAGEDI